MKILKHIINWTVWTLVSLYAVVMLAVQTPMVQQELGNKVSRLVGEKLGTTVKVGRVDLGFLNRLILDDVVIYDQRQKEMLKVARMTAKIDVAPLAIGRISVSSAQVFGARLSLYKMTKDAPANFQFVLDSLASTDTTSQTPLDLRINSFIMRHSSVNYDQWDAVKTPEVFNPQHVMVSGISAHIILKALREDSLNINVKRLTFLEQSGFNVHRLAFRLTANNKKAELQSFRLQLPNTDLRIDSIQATYDLRDIKESLCLKGSIDNSHAAPADFKGLLPALKFYQGKVALSTRFEYEDKTLSVPSLQLLSDRDDLTLQANGRMKRPKYGKDVWNLNVTSLNVTQELTEFVSKHLFTLPEPVSRLGDIHLKGSFSSDAEGTLQAQADLTTDIGHTEAQLQLRDDKQFTGSVSTDEVNIGQLLANEKLGIVATNMEVSGTLNKQIAAKGTIGKFEYDGYTYTNIDLDGSYAANHLDGRFQISDPRLAALLELDLDAKTLNDAVGVISIHNLNIPEKDYQLSYLRMESGYDEGVHFVTLNSDFAHALIV